jgi:hypothetical protein
MNIFLEEGILSGNLCKYTIVYQNNNHLGL